MVWVVKRQLADLLEQCIDGVRGFLVEPAEHAFQGLAVHLLAVPLEFRDYELLLLALHLHGAKRL